MSYFNFCQIFILLQNLHRIVRVHSPLPDVLRLHLHGGTSKDRSAKIYVHWMFCSNLICLLCVVKQIDR